MGLGSVCMTSMNEDLCGPCLQQRLQPTARLALFCSTAASFSEDQTQIHTSDCIEFPFFLPYSCYCSLFKIKYVNAKTITSHLMNNKYHFFAAVLQDVGFSSDKWSKNDVSLAPPVCEVEAKSSCCPTNSSLNVSDSKAPFDVANDSRRIYTVLDELMMSPLDWYAKIIVKFDFCRKRCVYVYLNSVFDHLFFNSKEYS